MHRFVAVVSNMYGPQAPNVLGTPLHRSTQSHSPWLRHKNSASPLPLPATKSHFCWSTGICKCIQIKSIKSGIINQVKNNNTTPRESVDHPNGIHLGVKELLLNYLISSYWPTACLINFLIMFKGQSIAIKDKGGHPACAASIRFQWGTCKRTRASPLDCQRRLGAEWLHVGALPQIAGC